MRLYGPGPGNRRGARATAEHRQSQQAPGTASPPPALPPPIQVVNVTILAIESERPDTRIDACLGQPLAFFLTAENSTALGDSFRPDDVHAAVSASDFCPVGDGNVVNITVRLVGPPHAHVLPRLQRRPLRWPPAPLPFGLC